MTSPCAYPNRIDVLGCPVDNLTMTETLDRIDVCIRQGGWHQIVPVNAAKLWRMKRDSRLDSIVRSASLITSEKAIVMGSRVLGTPLLAHVGGIMLLKALLPVATARGYRMFFLGARQEVVEAMIGKLKSDFPGLQIVGWHNGYLDAAAEADVLRTISEIRPDICIVAMGTPKQEYWVSERLKGTGVTVAMGVGGSFDVLAGLKKDAPDWVRAIAMEWLYRLILDPKNLWKRYLTTIPWFCWRLLAERVRRWRYALVPES